MKFLAFSLLTFIALLAVACSSDGSPSGKGTTGSPGASASPAPGQAVLKAVPPANPGDFLSSFGTVLKSSKDCKFDLKTSTADCTNVGLGKYQLSPPPQQPDAVCHALLNDTTPVGLVCSAATPRGTATPGAFGAAIYQIQK